MAANAPTHAEQPLWEDAVTSLVPMQFSSSEHASARPGDVKAAGPPLRRRQRARRKPASLFSVAAAAALAAAVAVSAALALAGGGFQQPRQPGQQPDPAAAFLAGPPQRRALLAAGLLLAAPSGGPSEAAARGEEVGLKMTQLPSGLKIADVKQGEGEFPGPGTKVTVDYVMMTTGARYGAKISSTKDLDTPYTFVVGDSSVIAGLSEAVSTMRAGGIRRVIIPEKLGYTTDTKQPQPANSGEYQRFKNIYLNPNRVYQPDLVFDLKLFRFDDKR